MTVWPLGADRLTVRFAALPSVTVTSAIESIGSAPTLTVTVAVSEPPLPSLTVYEKVSVPENPAFGTYCTAPPTMTAVPFAAAPTAEIVSVSPSTSVSFASTSTSTGVPALVDAVSSFATGSSLIGRTVTVMNAEAEPPRPSLIA